MDKELLFAQTLEKVKTTARAQGNCISKNQVEEAFAPLAFTGEQLEMVYDYLQKHKIGIGEPLDQEEVLTEEERDYLKDYLASIVDLDRISEGEKEAITLSAMAGEISAQKRLAEIYLPTVPDIARLYLGQGVSLEDLIGEGNVALAVGVGMLGCLEHAEEAQGMLGKMMMDAMENYIEEHSANAKIDRRALKKVNEVLEKSKELYEELRRPVTVDELSEESGLAVEEIEDAIRISGYKMEYIQGGSDV